jgi:type IV secretory pathway VirB2 component (pilin)
MKSNRNLDFVYLALLPFIAALAFLGIYINGSVPQIPVPSFSVPWSSNLEDLRQFASQNVSTAIAVAVAIVAGIIGCTWFVMVILDLRKALHAFVRWILRRPPTLVSGLLRPDADNTWTVSMGTINEPIKTYRAKRGTWLGEPPA